MKITNIQIKEHKIEKNETLKKIEEQMISYGMKDPMSLLPKPWWKVDFDILHSYSGIANGIRRFLIEEMPTWCLSFNEKKMETDDEFILSDLLYKNITLLPITQEIDENTFSDCKIKLFKFNNTTEIIDIKASDIIVESKSKHPPLIPNANILIIRLRPGKFIKIDEFKFLHGRSFEHAGKFSLLNNVSFKQLTPVNYDMYKKEGSRSIEYDPTDFHISFSTAGNILPKTIFNLIQSEFKRRLESIENKIKLYEESKENKLFFTSDNFEVSFEHEIYFYKFMGEYITIPYMIAQKSYMLDNDVLFCSPGVIRYDSNVGFIKIKHPEPNTLLLKATKECMKEIDSLCVELIKHL